MLVAGTILLAIVIGLLVGWLIIRKEAVCLIADVYRLPGKWYLLKRIAFACYFRHHISQKVSRLQDNLVALQNPSLVQLEQCLALNDDPCALDSVYIGGLSQNGLYLACRIIRKPNRRAEVWLLMDVPGVGFLQHPLHPDTLISNCDPKSFSAGGLRFDIVHPMKTWRISYSGQLRVGSFINKTENLLDVDFAFQWNPFTPPLIVDKDFDPSFLADAVACEDWNWEYFQKLERYQQSYYEQWGELRGTLNIEGHSRQYHDLKAVRNHSFGIYKMTELYRHIKCFVYIENGLTLQIAAICQPGMFSNLKYGGMTYPSGNVVVLETVNLKLWEIGETDHMPPDKWGFTFVADGQHYHLLLSQNSSSILFHQEADGGAVVHEIFSSVTLNGRKGWGISEFLYRSEDQSQIQMEDTFPLLTEPPQHIVNENCQKFILPFTSPVCCAAALVGGKGAQLAHLTQLPEKEAVQVPKGFCITLAAFEEHIRNNKSLQVSVNRLADISFSAPETLEDRCNEFASLLSEQPICAQVLEAVKTGLRLVWGNKMDNTKFAVRSSAAGEDGNEASSAGQMLTFLGVHSEQEILKAVQRCWGSAYTFQAVEYRRQHGQPVRTAVGLVIQEMIPAEAAGVMFTADPLTNSNSMIVITANYGLGESVVSGRCDPDTITVRKSWKGDLCIVKSIIGLKKTKMTMRDGEGIQEVANADHSHRCVSDDVIISLAQLGVQLEKYFGSARDVEWAFCNGDIFILQSRPITTFEQETEEELIHEFDTPLAAGNEWFTTSNVSEMMPGAVTPLTYSTFVMSVEQSLQVISITSGGLEKMLPVHKTIGVSGNHLFLSLTDLGLPSLSAAFHSVEVLQLSVMSQLYPNFTQSTLMEYAMKKPAGALARLFNSLKLFRFLNNSYTMCKNWEGQLDTYNIQQLGDTSAQLYTQIDQHLQDLIDVWGCTVANTSRSGTWAGLLMSVVNGGSLTWTTEHFSDIAILLSHCQDVYSAEVPTAIQDLAGQIVRDGLKEEYLAKSKEECLKLMNGQKYPDLKQKFATFLHRHGHRAVREAEMRIKSWHQDPTILADALKTVLKNDAYHKSSRKIVSNAELISRLKTSLSFLQRKILQLMLPRAQAGVASREWGKSLSIKMNDIFKQAYWRLANLMVQEGRLPDSDLLFFLTHQEIGTLLTSRSAHLVIKAQKRRRILSKQMSLRFPKVSVGHPKPIQSERKVVNNNGEKSTTVLKGIPVSHGIVQGPARVVLALSEAHKIQAGDILIVTCTDVGWTPYFPLVAGLVTEIGSIISHGAVVAREFGIPCVVSITQATCIVQDGMQVELNGGDGTLTYQS